LTRYNLYCVEDLAEAHGVAPSAQSVAACWSFYRNKVVHGEEGGAVSFPDVERARRARELRDLGHQGSFVYRPRGCNYRLAPSLANLALLSLRAFDVETKLRRNAERAYDSCFGVRSLYRDAPWVYDFRCDDPAKVVAELNAVGIAARRGFAPMHC